MPKALSLSLSLFLLSFNFSSFHHVIKPSALFSCGKTLMVQQIVYYDPELTLDSRKTKHVHFHRIRHQSQYEGESEETVRTGMNNWDTVFFSDTWE